MKDRYHDEWEREAETAHGGTAGTMRRMKHGQAKAKRVTPRAEAIAPVAPQADTRPTEPAAAAPEPIETPEPAEDTGPEAAAPAPEPTKTPRRADSTEPEAAAALAPEPVSPKAEAPRAEPVLNDAAQLPAVDEPAAATVLVPAETFDTPLPRPDLPRTRSTRVPPWDRIRTVRQNQRRNILDMKPLVDLYREDPVSRGFDLLRTRLMQTLRQNGWSRIAIAGPTSGCGATFTAVNLALSLSRVPGSRTILLDMNQRDPGVAALLGLGRPGQLHEFLSGQVAPEDYLVRLSDTLALGLNRGGYENPAELLHDPEAAAHLEQMQAALTPDVTLCDLPPILAHDDLAAFLPQVDGVLLVSDGTRTTARHIAACERILSGQTELLGVVLNRARKPGLFSRVG
jgi:Mrp family chromosome partitioning ATPase